MAEHKAEIVVNLKDNTSQSFKLIGTKFKGLQTDVSGLAKVLGGAVLTGFGALATGIFLTTKAAGEAEASLTRVTATLTAMGESALKNKDAILEASKAAVKLGFDDEQTAESITRFYQATNDLTKANELTSLAMDLARAKNLDLATATMLVNQVLGGNGRALKQYQIDLKETNDPLAALGELHDKVKGQAEAFAGTFQGQMAVIRESVNNMKETIGAALLEAIMPFVQQLTQWASKPDVQQKIKDMATAIGEFAKVAIPIAIDAIKLWKSAFDGIVAVIGEIIYLVSSAINKIGELASKAGSLVGKGGISGLVVGATSGLIKSLTGAKAEGGPVMSGGRYLVGERGPEIFTPSSSGFITPNGGGSGISIIITGNTLLDSHSAEKIGDLLISRLKLSSQV